MKEKEELQAKIDEQQAKIDELQAMVDELTKKPENIATCAPTKALTQCYKISEKLEKWLTITDIANIRKKAPKLLEVPSIPDNATEEEKAKIREKAVKAIEENDRRLAKQSKDNWFEIIKSVMGEHPQETVELIAMCCFIEPEDMDNYPLTFYMDAVSDIFENESILRFFNSSVRLVLRLSKTV